MGDHEDSLLTEATGKRWKGIRAAGVAIVLAGLGLLFLATHLE